MVHRRASRPTTPSHSDRDASFEEKLAAGWRPRAFTAIDFETANRHRASACAVALVRAEGGRVVDRRALLVRPPTARFEFTWVHGIRWEDVKEKPCFGGVWRSISSLVGDVDFIAAHNAGFDQNVLETCCDQARLKAPDLPFVCTVKLARMCWNLRPARLPNVCKFLGIELRHHDPLSDAEACAGIVMAATAAARPKDQRE